MMGAILIRLELKISASNPISVVVAGPVINRNPIMISKTDIQQIIKLTLLKARFFCDIVVVVIKF